MCWSAHTDFWLTGISLMPSQCGNRIRRQNGVFNRAISGVDISLGVMHPVTNRYDERNANYSA